MTIGELAGQEREAQRRIRRIRFLGHATVLIDLGYTRILTDPLLRHRISGLVWRHPRPRSELDHEVDGVVISHMHQDHLDLPSLRKLGREVPLLVPRRAGRFLTRRGFTDVHELQPDQSARIGDVRVIATPANHTGFRPPFGPFGGCLGFVVEGMAGSASSAHGGAGADSEGSEQRVRIYFAGDTDLFPEMDALGPIDVALLPVAGWGPTLGPGHMDPYRAAQSLRLIAPKVAVPIHWGTFAPFGMHVRPWQYLIRPPLDFQEYARELAPDVEVHILEPGESLDLEGAPAHAVHRASPLVHGVDGPHPAPPERADGDDGPRPNTGDDL
jgi:L-ascorbate metabolism protein UlaG (beta-lactamase superfamily)